MSQIQYIEPFRISEDGGETTETQDRHGNYAKAVCEYEPRAGRTHCMLESFTTHRQMLFRIACRILGSVADADDMVQELWLRWQRQDSGRIQSAKAWLGAAMTRLCIDQLRSARRQWEDSYGVSVPEPSMADGEAETNSSVDREYSLTTACAKILETLRPVERAVFMLHEVFGYDHVGTAAIVGKDVSNCRQILHRAKAHLKADSKMRPVSVSAHRLAKQIAVAADTDDVSDLLVLLTEEEISFARGSTAPRRCLAEARRATQ
jgi:RNA polymerase sigma-70 factor, ECF subfamily